MCDTTKVTSTQVCSDNGPYYIGVDVGTGSARAALVRSDGKIITVATHPIHIFESEDNFYEQSSDDVWQACCKVVNAVHENVDKEKIHGIGFDATCSLVVLDKECKPLSVSPSSEGNEWNIIMWMDHRAGEQAERINATNHEVLKYVGGKISLEMQTPKLLWLKENMKERCWEKAGYFFDLPDFLTWKATGCLTRSLCSTVCKWTYICDSNGIQGWNDDYFQAVGLADLTNENYEKIGTEIKSPGEVCGKGLTTRAAEELGLNPGTVVATSILDAHAGGLGSVGCSSSNIDSFPVENRLAIICGTSTCHMAVKQQPVLVPGVWGPYYSAMVPGMWLNEGGQSAVGKLLDHIIENHPAYSWVKDDASTRKVHVHSILNEILEFILKKSNYDNIAELTTHFHIYPDFRGNRSPLADQTLRGMVSGLSLTSGAEDLAIHYLAAIQGLACSTKHIIDAMTDAGHNIKVMHACGGLSKNQLYIQTHADVTGLPVILPNESESVLLGSAILAACASKDFSTLQEAMDKMGGQGTVIHPNEKLQSFHKKKYSVYLKMIEHQQEYRSIMN